jgi:hypothetical protein
MLERALSGLLVLLGGNWSQGCARGLSQRARAELGKEEQENRRTGEQERRCRRCSPTGELPVILSTLEKDTLVFVSPQSAMSITGPTAVPGD